jgi:hypothetical protein
MCSLHVRVAAPIFRQPPGCPGYDPTRRTEAIPDEFQFHQCGRANSETGWAVYWIQPVTFEESGTYIVTVQSTLNRRITAAASVIE